MKELYNRYQLWFIGILSIGSLAVSAATSIYGSTPIGNTCSTNNACVGIPGVSSECRNFRCTCKESYTASYSKQDCLSLVNEIGGQCMESSQCNLGSPGPLSACNEDHCECLPEAVNEQGQHVCRRKATNIGDSCVADVQCTANLGYLSECETNRCACSSGISVTNIDGTECLLIVNEIGGVCLENQQCTFGLPGQFSHCLDAVCSCTANSFHEPGYHRCLLFAEEVGDTCELNFQCQSNLGEFSYCSGITNTCECYAGSVPSPDNKLCIKERNKVPIGSSCNSSNECYGNSAFNVECTESAMCACRPGYVTNILMNDCLPIVNNLNSYCSESQQCQQGTPGTHSDCRNSPTASPNLVCKCTHDAVNQPGNDKCFLKTLVVGSLCEIQEQCIANLEHSQCIDGACQCLKSAQMSKDGAKCVIARKEM